jgi:hypothetical protein
MFAGTVSEKDILKVIYLEKKIFNSSTDKYIAISYYEKGLKLPDKKMISLFAEHTNHYQKHFESAYVIGISGMDQILANIYNFLAARSYPRKYLDTLLDLENKLEIKFPLEFVEYNDESY